MPRFRDPVHGFIELTADELKIVDSAPFQRLRNIKQLATTYLVYHGAEHTRYGHSLGVMHLVTRVFDSINAKNPCLFHQDEEENEKIVIRYRQILRLIALTHDLGHAPFSHASEELFPKGRKHEDYTKDIIEKTEINTYITDIGNKLTEKYGSTFGITPTLLWKIYGNPPSTIDEDYIWPDFPFLHSFVDSEMDCDKMDYLLRDSLFCGVSYGKYDLERFISTLTVYKNPDEKILQLAISSGGIQAFEEFVLARYFMFIQVYFHKTRRYYDMVLINCLRQILPDEHYPLNLDDYLQWDDTRVIQAIKENNFEDAKEYRNRKANMTLLRETKAHAEEGDKDIIQVYFNILSKTFPAEKFLIDTIDKAAHKFMPSALASEDDSGREIKIIDKQTKEARNIMRDSRILDSIVRPISIKRLYVPKLKYEEANVIIKEIER